MNSRIRGWRPGCQEQRRIPQARQRRGYAAGALDRRRRHPEPWAQEGGQGRPCGLDQPPEPRGGERGG